MSLVLIDFNLEAEGQTVMFILLELCECAWVLVVQRACRSFFRICSPQKVGGKVFLENGEPNPFFAVLLTQLGDRPLLITKGRL